MGMPFIFQPKATGKKSKKALKLQRESQRRVTPRTSRNEMRALVQQENSDASAKNATVTGSCFDFIFSSNYAFWQGNSRPNIILTKSPKSTLWQTCVWPECYCKSRLTWLNVTLYKMNFSIRIIGTIWRIPDWPSPWSLNVLGGEDFLPYVEPFCYEHPEI